MFTYRPATARDGPACASIVHDHGAQTPELGAVADLPELTDWWRGCLSHVDTSWVGMAHGAVIGFPNYPRNNAKVRELLRVGSTKCCTVPEDATVPFWPKHTYEES